MNQIENFKYGSIADKELSSLSKYEIAWLHLTSSYSTSTKDYNVISSLKEAEGTMRHTNTNVHSKNFGPLMCAFAIWDQLGSIYRDKSVPDYNGDNVNLKKALHYFGYNNLGEEEVNSIYMMRNGVYHDASFTSHNKSRSKWFLFRFDESIESIIKIADIAWSGEYKDISPETTTLLNIEKFIDMTSSAIEKLKNLLLNDQSKIDFIMNKEEMISKYLLYIKKG
jgi:hypothetical protein